MKLIVGLGNPEDRYASTRHNLGFEILEKYVKETGDEEWVLESKFKSEIIKRGELLFVKPQTFMNRSGMAVGLIANYYKVNPENVIIVHDELDLPLGKIKVRLGGAAAGHHGVESIIETLGDDKFIRLRLGIGNQRTQSGEHKEQTVSAENFVLGSFLPTEKSKVKHTIKQALKALDLLLEEGLEQAQSQFN